MFRSSFPLGRYFGVEVRMHFSLPVLLALAMLWGIATTQSAGRGFLLWCALMAAVIVREASRVLGAAYFGMRLRALFLLPIGGVLAFSGNSPTTQKQTRIISLLGPAANFFAGLLLLGGCYGLVAGINLVAQPWIGAGHVLRSAVWMQFVMGAVSLVPSSALPTAQVLGRTPKRSTGGATLAAMFGPATLVAMVMLFLGFVYMNLWAILLGGLALLTAQLSRQSTVTTPEAAQVRVRDVMLTEYTLLSTTDTLESALAQTVHSLHDVFPVVRGAQLVGAIARQTLIERMMTQGDTYIQGQMTRELDVATPEELLQTALQRAAARGFAELIPVAEDGRLIGVLTVQGLSRAAQQMQFVRRPADKSTA